jgi:hypothetical protein
MRQLQPDETNEPANVHCEKAIDKIQREVVRLQTAASKEENSTRARQIAYQSEIIKNAINALKLVY